MTQLPIALIIGQTAFDVGALVRVAQPALGRNPAATVDTLRRPLGDTERALLTLASAFNQPLELSPTLTPLASVVALLVVQSMDVDRLINELSPLSTFVVATVNPSVMLIVAGGSLATWRALLDSDALGFVAATFRAAQLC